MSSTANNAGSSLSKLVDFSGHGMEGLSKVCSIRGRFCVLTGDGDVFGKWFKSWAISMMWIWKRTGLDKISLWVGVECEVITEVKVVFISRVEVDFFVWLAVLLIVV